VVLQPAALPSTNKARDVFQQFFQMPHTSPVDCRLLHDEKNGKRPAASCLWRERGVRCSAAEQTKPPSERTERVRSAAAFHPFSIFHLVISGPPLSAAAPSHDLL